MTQQEFENIITELWHSNNIDGLAYRRLNNALVLFSNSMSECERQPVGNNEQTEKKCHASEDGYTHAMCVSHTSCENCKAYR